MAPNGIRNDTKNVSKNDALKERKWRPKELPKSSLRSSQLLFFALFRHFYRSISGTAPRELSRHTFRTFWHQNAPSDTTFGTIFGSISEFRSTRIRFHHPHLRAPSEFQRARGGGSPLCGLNTAGEPASTSPCQGLEDMPIWLIYA